jgi:N-acetylmuramoyl-L-alanine amidase
LKRFIGLLVFVFSFMTVSQVSAAKDDLAGYDWAKDHIYALAERKIMEGTGPNQYSPGKNVTRAEFATLVSKALQLPPSDKSFPDLGQAYHGLQDGIKKAAGAGIVSGSTDGKFYPNNSMSRQEMAIMVDNAMKYKKKQSTESKLSFKDNNSIQYKEAVGRVVGAGLLTGYEDNAFGPHKTSSRAMAAVVLSKMVSYIEGKPLVVEKPKPEPKPEPEQPKQQLPFVVIDAGHDGSSTGARGNGLKEEELTLDVALRVKELLAKTSIPFALTRETSAAISRKQRVAFAKEKNAGLFVSIHINSEEPGYGTETFFYEKLPKAKIKKGKPERNDSYALAGYVQKRLVEKLQLRDRGVKTADHEVTREADIPAILAELAFITSKDDAAKLATPAFRQKAAEAIYLGITDYLTAKGYKL